jgi:hypothetical protein
MRLALVFFAVSLARLWPQTVETASPRSGELIVCGGDEVFIVDVQQPGRKVWTWRASGHPELPKAMQGKFHTTADCKAVEGGSRILIASSGDGVALVERSSGRAVFYGSVANAHSAEMLPGHRLVVASSIAPEQPGDRLVLFDLEKSDQPLFHTEFHSAHGVMWDGDAQVLWALGGDFLRSYRLVDWATAHPRLEQAAEYRLPDSDGHDLSAVPGTGLLAVTTMRHVWLFDRKKRTFSPHPQLGPEADVKCVSVDPLTRQTVWIQADKGGWWTGRLRFLGPDKTVQVKGERIYKARWSGATSTVEAPLRQAGGRSRQSWR